MGAIGDGPWTSLSWVAGSGPWPNEPVAAAHSFLVSVYSWSRGFIAFRTDWTQNSTANTTSETVSTSTSPDGLHWTAGGTLHLDGPTSVMIAGVVESAGGLMAIGMNSPGVCGGPFWLGALFASPDGRAWTSVDIKGPFGDATVLDVSAGSAGYIASGHTASGTDAVWTSRDGRSWQRSTLPSIGPATLHVSGTVAFAGGYLLGGAIEGDGGCGGPNMVMPSVWSSPDGRAWTRRTIPGATAGRQTSMRFARIGDQTVLAMQETWNPTTQESIVATWVSNDGRSWRRVKAEQAVDGSVYSNGRTSLVIVQTSNATVPISILGFDAAMSLRPVSFLTGAPAFIATEGFEAALGPTGLLVCTTDASSCYVAVPH